MSEDSRVSGGCCEGSNRTPWSGGWQSAAGGCVGFYLSKLGASWQEGQLGTTQGWVAAMEGILSSHRGLEAGRSRRAGTGVLPMRGKAAGRGLPELSGQGSLVGRLDATRILTFRLSLSRRPWPYLAHLCPSKRVTGLGRWDRRTVFPKLLRLLINLLAKAKREAPKAKFS